MANRRLLGAAMNLSEDKLAFIKSGTTAPSLAQERVSAPTGATLEEKSVPSDSERHGPQAPDIELDRIETRSPRGRNRTTATKRVTIETSGGNDDFYGQALVPLTTRLRAPTADALRRACLEQKLARRSPNTQQEIVELALLDWLRIRNYL